MNFKILLRQYAEDASDPITLLRTSHISIKESLSSIKIQLPCAYAGPSDEEGKEKNYTPEDLYLGALAGCFFTTLNVVCRNSNFNYISVEIDAEGFMEEIDGVKMMSKVNQKITLTIPRSANSEKASKILNIVEQRCPLAKSVKTKITNKYIIKTAD